MKRKLVRYKAKRPAYFILLEWDDGKLIGIRDFPMRVMRSRERRRSKNLQAQPDSRIRKWR